MNLVRFQPRHYAANEPAMPHEYQPLSRLHNDIDRLFNGFFTESPWGRMTDMLRQVPDFVPSLDLKSDAAAYTLSLELPGVAQDDVKVNVLDNTLTISGEKKAAELPKEASQHVQERSYGSFSRSMTLPEDADVESICATHKDGVLTITIPRKAPEKPQARAITITHA